MSPFRDDELIGNLALRRAVEAHRAALSQPALARSRHWPMGWLIGGVAIGTLLIVLLGLVRLAGIAFTIFTGEDTMKHIKRFTVTR